MMDTKELVVGQDLRTPRRKARTAALKVGEQVTILGRHDYCRCWGDVLEQNGPKGVEVAIEGGICSFDEYGVDVAYFWDEQQSGYRKDDRGVRFYWVDNSDGKGGCREYDPNNPPADTTNGPWYIAL
jgi:hypothetical protein